jgi:hypothetical protein
MTGLSDPRNLPLSNDAQKRMNSMTTQQLSDKRMSQVLAVQAQKEHVHKEYVHKAFIETKDMYGQGYQEAQPSFVPEFGVLYINYKTALPDDWAGAKITSFKREAFDKGWRLVFESKWDPALYIQLWLDIEEVNGTEANTIAATYMEALNQRRIG